jgi:multidrug resistance protein
LKKDKELWVLVFICIINSIGFGIIVPLLYPYGKEFGLTQQTLGWLTASFSIAQFFATPVLGSLSDKYGRKPLLAISLIGTCISFIMFAEARSIVMLFAARILDGITGGNVSVAQAMVSDTSTPQNRAKKFGILGSAFGFGFIIGPALGGLLSKWGIQVPFFFAAFIALTGTLCTLFLLKETNPRGTIISKERFTFTSFITVLKMPAIGTAIIIGFLLTMAQFTMIIGFQAFTVDVLRLTPANIGLFYAGFAVTGIIMQLAVPLFLKISPSKANILMLSTALCLVAMFASGFTAAFITFAGCMLVYGLFNGLRNPMINSLIADNNDPKKQGQVMGITQSYASIGQTLGPISAGLISVCTVHYIFWLASFYILIAFLLSFRLKARE